MTMRFHFLKLLDRTLPCCIFYPEVVRDNVVCNKVTITSSLRSDVVMLGINFQFSY